MRHLNEDLGRPEITEPAKGVLFGNPFRLTEPNNREQPLFTVRVHLSCKTNLEQHWFTRLTMFPLVNYLKCNSDPTLSKQIRKAIVESEGEIVKFPDVPSMKDTSKN